MKTVFVPPSHVLAAALLPVGMISVTLGLVLWFGYGWHQDASAARAGATKDRVEAAGTEKRVAFLRGSKAAVDETWLELSAGTVRVATAASASGGGYGTPGGPGVNLADVPLNRGAAASSGLSSGSRPRDLPEPLNALAEADFVIIPQPASNDRSFRRYAIGSDKIEFGRLLPLVASVESRFPLALVEEAVFAMPASQPVFGSEPHALESRLVMRLPLYDPAARQRDARGKQKTSPPAGVVKS